MKITFDNNAMNTVEQNKVEHHKTGRERNASRSSKVNSAYGIDAFKNREENWQKGTSQNGKKGKTAQDIQQSAESMDAGVIQNFMTVMSHTISQEDRKSVV